MRRNHYRTNKKVGYIIYGWRFGIDGLVHENMNTKKGILLQLIPHSLQIATSQKTGVGVTFL